MTNPVPAVPLVDPAAVEHHLTSGGAVFDVRSDESRARFGAIPGAVPLSKPALAEAKSPDAVGLAASGLAALASDSPIVVYCGSDEGSRESAEKLRAFGFTSVSHLAGGFPAWQEAGLPVAPVEVESAGA